MLLKQGRIVITPRADQPYKVVLEHETQGTSEQAVATVREGEALIRGCSRPAPESALARFWGDHDAGPAAVVGDDLVVNG